MGTAIRYTADDLLVRAPDIAFVAAGRLPASLPVGYLHLAPDLAVDVSPSDTVTELGWKVEEYVRATELFAAISPS